MTKNRLQRLIEVFVIFRAGADVAEEFAWQNEESLLLHQAFPRALCVFVGHGHVVKAGIPRRSFSTRDIVREILRNIAIKHCTEHISEM